MPSLRTTAVAALATAALVVPATASAQSGTVTIGTPTQLQVNLPAESEWTSCAREGARCAFTGTRQVRYGANGKFTLPRTFTGGVDCNNGVFGDPAPNVVKECQVTGGSQTKDEAATAAAISSQPASNAPACGPTAVEQAELEDMVAKLNAEIANGQGNVTDAAKMIAEVQKIAGAQQAATTPAREAELKAMQDAAAKARQEAAQSQANMSTAAQVSATVQDIINSLFRF